MFFFGFGAYSPTPHLSKAEGYRDTPTVGSDCWAQLLAPTRTVSPIQPSDQTDQQNFDLRLPMVDRCVAHVPSSELQDVGHEMTGQLSGSDDLEVQIQMRPWDSDESQKSAENEAAEDEVIRTETDHQIRQLMPKVVKSIAKMGVNHPEVLRTARAHQAFQHFAAALRVGSDGDFYYKSRKSHKISTFWSHSWHGGHWKKILTLILGFAR